MDEQDIVREFLLESSENLVRLDQEIVELEARPTDADLLASIFRTVHSIKGTCGFLGFDTLEGVAHQGENILSQLRSGQKQVNTGLISLVLECIDAIKAILNSIEQTGGEGLDTYKDLKDRLEAFANQQSSEPLPAHLPTSDGPGEGLGIEPGTGAGSETEPGAAGADTDAAPGGDVSPEADDSNHTGEANQPNAEVANPASQDETPTSLPNPLAQVVGEGEGSESAADDAQLTAVAEATNTEPQHRQPPASQESAPAAEHGAKPAPASAGQTVSVSDSAIRVDVGLLDKLMNLVGELVLARNQVLQFNTQWEDVTLNATSQRLNLITTELQEGVMKTRMQPIGLVWNKLPRLVRDVAHSLGKQIKLEMDGAHTELDKTIIEAIKDPLTHLVRNSCDHGLETPEARLKAGKPAQGTITLRAYHEGGQVNIEIHDNGTGIDPEKLRQRAIGKGVVTAERAARMSDREALNLIFAPGFSTAQTITNVSGRGVGMDVVKNNIERIGGAVDVSTQLGEWTTVKLKIPLTLAIIPGLVVTGGGERFVIPQVSLLELIRLDGASSGKIEHVHGTPVYRRRGSLLPIAYLSDILGLPASATETVNIVVLQAEDRQFGLVVDGVNDTQEIVVKPLGKGLKELTIYAGATIMGDGRVALILDVLGVGRQSGVLSSQQEAERANAQQRAQAADERQRLLLFRAGSFERLAVPLSLVSRLEEFPQSAIESTGESPVIQYRGGILPLISLGSILAPGHPDQAMEQDPAQVIVFQNGDRSVGITVERIIDIVEDAITVRHASQQFGLLGSAVIGGKVTEFVDLKEVLGKALAGGGAEDWLRGAPARPLSVDLLLIEASPFARSLLRAELEMAGYRVAEAGDPQQVGEALERVEPGVVLLSAELPDQQSSVIAETIRQLAPKAPILALSRDSIPPAALRERFDAVENQNDRPGMLASVAQLASAVTAEIESPADDKPVAAGIS